MHAYVHMKLTHKFSVALQSGSGFTATMEEDKAQNAWDQPPRCNKCCTQNWKGIRIKGCIHRNILTRHVRLYYVDPP